MYFTPPNFKAWLRAWSQVKVVQVDSHSSWSIPT